MRILLLSTSMGMGGADQQVLILARAMRARGHEVRIISLAPLGQMGEEAEREGIPIQSLGLRRNLGFFPGLMRLVRVIRQARPDILHSHMVHANLIASAVRAMAPVPRLIATIHSINPGGPFRVAAYRLSSRMVDQFTIISRLSADHYVSIGAVPRERLQVIPNTVDIERFQRSLPARAALRKELGVADRFVWIAVGRFEEAKDYPTMIGGFARLVSSRPDALLLLVGKGSLKEEVEQLIRQHGLEEQVRFLGVRRDVPELLSTADGYVLSSAWEGMPVVLLEAAALELPIVATRVGGVAEVVDDGSTGILVQPGDPASLAEAMGRIQSLSPEERARMGARGRSLVEQRYGTERVMDVWERLYRANAGVPSGQTAGQRKV